MFALLLGVILGAAVMYFLDPNGGARRRNLTRDRAISYGRTGVKNVGTAVEMAAGQAQGVVSETIPTRRDNPNPDDPTLKDRIESELFRDPTLGRDKMNITVIEDGIVQLRGELPTEADIQSVVSRVKSIRDVTGVESYLHTPGTPAPNKEQAIEAS
jgi:osmotically-inducible protein OsmY